MYKLIIEDDEGKTTVVPLIRDEISIGRKEGNTIRLTERNVSRRHAKLIRQNGAVYIEDLTSHNGIKVNGDRITGRAAVGEGDRIQIGDYQLSVKLDREAAKSQPAAAPQRPEQRVGEDGATTPFVKPEAAPAHPPMIAPMATQQISMPTVPHQVVTAPQAQNVPDRPARLVVVSKNFAGQEFPLDKAAVVIGRTDENDVVVNHRSISRHHAKIVREGGHYHIVDLQSANGVRVNGEEYGKVELRKGDKIDLGHVRMVFVSPGQEFDIRGKIEETEPAGKRSGLALFLLALLILGGVAGVTRYLGLWPAGTVQKADPDGEAAKLLVEVDGDLGAKRWPEAIEKADRVLRMTDISQGSRDSATTKKGKADSEKKVQGLYDRFSAAGGERKYDEALNIYREIPPDSAYRAMAQDDYDKIFPLFAEDHLKKAEAFRIEGKCGDFKGEVQKVLAISREHIKAKAEEASPCPPDKVKEPGEKLPKRLDRGHTHVASDPKTEDPKDPEIRQPTEPSDDEAEKKLHDAQEAYVNGDYPKALDLARPFRSGAAATRAWRIIGGAACQIKDLHLINDAYKHLDATNRQFVMYVCHRSGITFANGQFRIQE